MTETTADLVWNDETEATAPEQPQRRPGWVLMGDIVSHRAGVAEHLIQWRRAMGEADPEPMLGSSSWSEFRGEREEV